ncbi:MAG TPA: MFS transporter, partial [Geobacterales bacterium]|nr:MFS transporter [Geobacterales bacterium]
MNWRAIVGGTIGWMVDVYDLTLLLFVTNIIASAFFPSGNPLISLLSVFASYALSLLARPLGGIIFGHVADRVGRRITMLITLLGLGIFSALSGALPTYAEIGLLAPALFVLLRLLVGIFVGGEVSGSHLIAVEASDNRRRGLTSGILQSGYYWGYALAAVTFLAMASYFGQNFSTYGWRYAFYLSIVVSIVGLVLRLAVGESQLFDEVKKEGKILRVPISGLFKNYLGETLVALLVMSGIYWVAYATLGYLPTYLRSLKYNVNFIFSALAIAGVIGAIMTILGGIFSDYLTRKRSFLVYSLIGILLSIPAIQLLYTNNFLSVAIAAGLITGFIGLSGGVMLAYLSELFATNVRASAIGFIWNMANIGSTVGLLLAPIVSLYSIFWGYAI